MLLVDVNITTSTEAREAVGRSLLRPEPTHPLPANYQYAHKEEEKEEEKEHHVRRGLTVSPNPIISLTEKCKHPREFAAVHHLSNSMTDDPSQPTAVVGTAKVWPRCSSPKSRTSYYGAEPWLPCEHAVVLSLFCCLHDLPL